MSPNLERHVSNNAVLFYAETDLPSSDLLGGRTFLLVLKKLHFWYLFIFHDFDLFCVDSLSDNRLAVACN